MQLIFDCKDEICLPKAYELIAEIKPFVERMKNIEVDEKETEKDRKTVFMGIIKNIMVNYPNETSVLFKKLWILDEGEEAPNTFRTMTALLTNEVAVDFFTQALPSMLQLSGELLPLVR